MKLEMYLKKNDIPKKDFAKLVGISSTYISLIIHGERNPSVNIACRIIQATQGEVSVNDLFPPESPVRVLIKENSSE